MKRMGVSELKKHISEILRIVQEEGEIIEVTNRSKVVARLVPAHKVSQVEELSEDEVWTDLERLSAEISAHWPAGLSALSRRLVLRSDARQGFSGMLHFM